MTENQKRITVRYNSPNPLFEEWLTKWRDEAIDKGSKMKYCFETALKSLKRYPIPFTSGKECKILKGFGDKLCMMLDEKLKEHQAAEKVAVCNELNADMVMVSNGVNKASTSKKNSDRKKARVPKANRSSDTYVPQHGSGGYAILLTLLLKSQEANFKGYLGKAEIIEHAKMLSTKSFTKPDPGSFYTAWSSMQTLISKGMVLKWSNPAKFKLTDQGMALAISMQDQSNIDDHENIDNFTFPSNNYCSSSSTNDNFEHEKDRGISSMNEISGSITTEEFITLKRTLSEGNAGNKKNKKMAKFPSESAASSSSEKVEVDYFIIESDKFDVILLVDNQENSDSKNCEIQDGLKSQSILYETRNLKVGDYAWVCRCRSTQKELVLPYLIERKRMDDLAKSIKDGRYYEQKFRLKRSGIENLTYLIENYGNNSSVGLPLASLHQAATNTALQDDFYVHFTNNIKETTCYLAGLSRSLIKLYKCKTLVSCSKEDLKPVDLNDDLVYLMEFKLFNKSSVKSQNMKVSDMFVKVLIQIKGMSVEKAIAIVEKYPTLMDLYDAYENTSGDQKEKLLADIKHGKMGKIVGAVLSKTVYQLVTSNSY